MNFRNFISSVIVNRHGWFTSRKLVVIESDDWGSIRMPNRHTYKHCLESGYPVHKSLYDRYDSLESEEDLEKLFEVLRSVKNRIGQSPIITANCVVSNPNFEAISDSGFFEYFYEKVTETFRKTPNALSSFSLWKLGLEEKFFVPQFHAREHLNVSLFMEALRNNDADAHFAFKAGMPGIMKQGVENMGNNFIEATRYSNEKDKFDKLSIYLEGLRLFEEILGYKSKSIIPTNYLWSEQFNSTLRKAGVDYIQGTKKGLEPKVNEGGVRIYERKLGENRGGLISLVRNCFFEPTLTGFESSVTNCLNQVNLAFMLKRPAIICSHRINYVGTLDKHKRDNNLIYLRQLLSMIVKKWPDVEFVSSAQLGDIITKSANH